MTVYYYETAVKDLKSFLLRIRTLNCQWFRFLNLTVKKCFTKKMNNTYCNQSGFQPPLVSMIPRGTHKVQFNIQSTFQVILWPFVSSGVSVNGRRIGSLRTHCHCYTTFLYSKLFSMSSSRRPRFLSESFGVFRGSVFSSNRSLRQRSNDSKWEPSARLFTLNYAKSAKILPSSIHFWN